MLLPLLEVHALSPPSVPRDAITRRSFVHNPLVASITTIALGISHPSNSAEAAMDPIVSDGMSAFARGDVARSIQIYDQIIRAEPRRTPYLWQRGLSLYYAQRYKDGAEQFAADVAVNPNDTEEQIWHLLCLAQLKEGGLEAARPMQLKVGRDRRPVMRAVQSLFLSGENETEVVELAERGDIGSQFYAKLYLSLYYESLGNP